MTMDNVAYSVSEVLLTELSKLGVEYVFLVPGAQITPLVFSLYAAGKIKAPKPIIANHELAAGYMAIGYARASGNMGVAISIGGPGAAYMLGAGVTAKTDDVPVLFITGNIPTDRFDSGEFQDASTSGTNDSATFKEATGVSMVCNKPEDLGNILIQIRRCNKDLKPIHVQIPINIQKANYPFIVNEEFTNCRKSIRPQFAIPQKTRTILLVGQKALSVIDPSKLREFTKRNSIAVITDMKSRGILPETERESLGYIGFNNDIRALEVFNCESPLALEQLVTVGVNEGLIQQFVTLSRVEHFKIDPQDINSWIDGFTFDHRAVVDRKLWHEELNDLIPPQPHHVSYQDKITYTELINTLKETVPKDVIYCLDSGQIRRAGSIFLTSYFPRTLLQSETLSPMGLGICSAIGAQLAAPEKHIVSLFGDGSMRMNGIELSTAVRYSLPIIFILCDNKSYASIKAPAIVKELPDVNWEKYGKSIGIETYHVDNQFDFSKRLEDALIVDKPTLLWASVPDLLDGELQHTEVIEYKNWLSTIETTDEYLK